MGLGYTIFCSFFLYPSFLYNNKSCRMQKKDFKISKLKKTLKNSKFRKCHSAFFAHFFFIYLFCIIIKAVKCKKKISKFQNSKKTRKKFKISKKVTLHFLL